MMHEPVGRYSVHVLTVKALNEAVASGDKTRVKFYFSYLMNVATQQLAAHIQNDTLSRPAPPKGVQSGLFSNALAQRLVEIAADRRDTHWREIRLHAAEVLSPIFYAQHEFAFPAMRNAIGELRNSSDEVMKRYASFAFAALQLAGAPGTATKARKRAAAARPGLDNKRRRPAMRTGNEP